MAVWYYTEGLRIFRMNYWVITSDEKAYGPYEDYALAYAFATTNLGFEDWIITNT